MSLMGSLTVTCPGCGHDHEMLAVESVNADRRPDLRENILDGTFQVETCPSCRRDFRLDPKFNYLDVGRGQWLSIQPLEELRNWIEMEDEAKTVFDEAYGDGAPSSARAIGNKLTARLTFGWAALREKLIVRDHDLDDATLELTKLALMGGFGGAPVQPGIEFRLAGIEGDDFIVIWIDALTERPIDTLLVPRAVYDSVVAAPEAWAPFRAQLTDGPFVDIQKLLIGEGRNAA
jgi:CpXC protein